MCSCSYIRHVGGVSSATLTCCVHQACRARDWRVGTAVGSRNALFLWEEPIHHSQQVQDAAATHARMVTASQDFACQDGLCRNGVQTYLKSRHSSFMLDAAIASSCSSPMAVHNVLVRTCASDLLADPSPGCSCTQACAQAIQMVGCSQTRINFLYT